MLIFHTSASLKASEKTALLNLACSIIPLQHASDFIIGVSLFSFSDFKLSSQF